jgi:hypothetical protein
MKKAMAAVVFALVGCSSSPTAQPNKPAVVGSEWNPFVQLQAQAQAPAQLQAPEPGAAPQQQNAPGKVGKYSMQVTYLGMDRVLGIFLDTETGEMWWTGTPHDGRWERAPTPANKFQHR